MNAIRRDEEPDNLHSFFVDQWDWEKVITKEERTLETLKVKINPETGTLIRDGVESILNHDDANALEEALALKDKYDDVEVIVVTMGPPQAKDMLLECLAKGADEAILLSDRAVGGSDTWATSNAVTAAIKKYGEFDLIFAGRQAIDGDTAQVGPQIAEKLDLPQVTYVQKFEISEDRKTVTVERKLEDGYEVIEVPVPCMLTAIKELNNPRYMSISGIYSAKDKPLHVWNAADVAVDLNTVGLKASPTNVFRSFTPKPKEPGHMVAGDTDKDLAKNLLIELKGKHVI
jgi:electron transfer flavoprotein beta subunit